MSALRTGLVSVLILSVVFTVGFELYASRPWRSPAYQTGDGSYLALLALLVYAASPTVGALLLLKLFRADVKALMAFLIGACAIAVCGVYICIDAMLTPDAQGALVFLAVPFYQWMAIPVLTIVCLAIRNLRAMRNDEVNDAGV